MKQDVTFKSSRGNDIRITRYGHKPFGQNPCVIYVHGFKGFKDWGFVPHLGAAMADAGIDLVTFNFSHNGIGPDGQSFTDLEGFSKNSFSLEKEETLEVINLCAFTDFFGNHLLKPLGIMGHSRGGGIALLAAAESEQVKAVCTWAAVSTFDRYSKQQIAAWKKKGYHEVINSRTGQIFKMGTDILKDVELSSSRKLNILEAVKDITQPLMIVHGQNDETVPYFEGEQLNIFANPLTSQLRLIPQGTHTFGAKHPFEEVPRPLEIAVEATQDFFLQHLSE